MNNAIESEQLFETGQYGALFIERGRHPRGPTLRIYALPPGETAVPLAGGGLANPDAIEVYGITSGQPGWTERYGWLHEGPWQKDFTNLVREREALVREREARTEIARAEAAREKERRKARLLDNWGRK